MFNLPNLPVKTGELTLVHDNITEGNNRANFAAEGNIVALVPSGLGMMIMAVDDVEVTANDITDNGTAGILVVSYLTVNFLGAGGPNDPEHDPYPETIFIHDNTFEGNGAAPHEPTAELLGVAVLEDVVWDGAMDENKPNEDGALDLCIQEDAAVTFRNFNILEAAENQTTDVSPHDCTHDAVPPVDLPFVE